MLARSYNVFGVDLARTTLRSRFRSVDNLLVIQLAANLAISEGMAVSDYTSETLLVKLRGAHYDKHALGKALATARMQRAKWFCMNDMLVGGHRYEYDKAAVRGFMSALFPTVGEWEPANWEKCFLMFNQTHL
eukprot:TRINITY_DN759_c0_g1_i5.p2 TRINITY_DN759_c0_g1~~TRINITY_DN759_c0_g1_i5.p2  ORF type:complete len:133 (-),score=34.25 TRINITY_DN759_c0_g1_i5:62-460(-)